VEGLVVGDNDGEDDKRGILIMVKMMKVMEVMEVMLLKTKEVKMMMGKMLLVLLIRR
jgi:hypothetical protein